MSKGAIIVLLIAGLALGGVATLAQASDSQWVINLKLHYGYIGSPTRDNVTFLGVRSGSTDAYDDGIDSRNPLAPPGPPYVDLYFYRTTWAPDETAYAEDWRAAIVPGTPKVWDDLRATANADPGTLILTWTIGLTGWEVPVNYMLTLYDEDTVPETAVDMRSESSYSFDYPGGAAVRNFRIEVTVNAPPECAFSWTPEYPAQGETVSFDGTASSDPDGTVVSWSWDFGDGGTDTGSTASHSYTMAGVYTVSLTVTDDEGASTTCTDEITVTPDPNMDWNCQLKAYWGAIDGAPSDLNDYFGVKPTATDDYDSTLDAKKPGEPLGNYVYAWFARPNWGTGNTLIMHDWRAPLAEGTTKIWGSGLTDTWNVKTNLDNGGSGYYDPVCDVFNELEYPIAASVFLTWEFGVSESPPPPLPPDDYLFTLQYKGGINAKPAGTGGSAPAPPAYNATWNMETTPHLEVPLWKESFTPWKTDCSGFEAADTAKFKIIVVNPAPNTPPVCDFSYSPTIPQAGETVNFDGSASYDPDGTVVAWDWNFGDGNTGSGATTSHVYPDAGQYDVCLVVTDDGGAYAECCQTITIDGPPTCTITYSPGSPVIGEAVAFDSNASDPDGGTVTASWDFDDSDGIQEDATGLTATHTYALPDTYTVTCTVTDDEANEFVCQTTVTVTTGPPVACFDIDPNPALPGQAVAFDASCSAAPAPIVSYAWDFGDTQSGSGVITTHTYAATGEYSVTLTITDDDGGTDTETKTVTVEYRPEDLYWNCNLKAYWGALEGVPHDLADFLGVQSGATDGFDLVDAKKPGEPLGDYVYAWFERQAWGEGRIMHDWRSPLPMGTSKVWGTGLTDTWNVKTNLDNGGSGYYDPVCDTFNELEYPIAASIYLSWEFGVSQEPPAPLPPDEYTFTLQYKGGINAKPAGTKLGDATVPAYNDTWDMEATAYIVVPLWNDAFTPWKTDCSGFEAADTAKFKIIVNHPAEGQPPTCAITVTGDTECATLLTFNANASDPDPGGTVVAWAWDFGDGGAATGDPATHAYGAMGTYTVTCTVTDDTGQIGSCQTDVTITSKTVSFFLMGPAWHMISIPCEPVDADPAVVFDELDPYGSPSKLSGNLHRFVVNEGYKTWYDFNPGGFGGDLNVGEGYWLYVFEDVTITYEACCSYGERALNFPEAGWYMIGHPQFVPIDVRWDNMQAELGASGRIAYRDAVPAWIGDPLVGYDPAASSYNYVTVGTIYPDHELIPFKGYWADVKEAGLTVYVPNEAPAP